MSDVLFCTACSTRGVELSAQGACSSCGAPPSAIEVHSVRSLADAPQGPREVDPRVVLETSAGLRAECGKRERGHDWQVVGATLQQAPGSDGGQPPVCLVTRACFTCSSFTWHVMQFVGSRDETLEDKVHDHLQGGGDGRVEGGGAAGEGGVRVGPGGKDGPDCQYCGSNDWRTSERFEDIRVCLNCEKPQMYRKPSKNKRL